MAVADITIEPKLLECAKEEFLSKPYEEVSLREICSKAGVTTGALYKRFNNKEALFEALVAPTLEVIKTLSDNTESFNYEQLDKMDMKYVWDVSPQTHKNIVNMMYDNYDGFRLLLCHSGGTQYANFIHNFVEDVSQRSMTFMREVHKRGMSEFLIDDEEFHMLHTAYWSTMFEPIVHGMSREKALLHCESVAKLFNWSAVLGF